MPEILMPKVTVLMSVFNGERYLREAMESILSQTFEDFEFLIINDGSTDRSREILLSYADSRIHLVDNEQNRGLTWSLNRGLRLATGQFVARQDADDISQPDRLSRQVEFLEKNTEVALLGSWYEKMDAEGNLIGKRKLPGDNIAIRWSLLFYCPFVHSAVMFRKQAVLERVGFYNEALAYSSDYDLWYRIASCMQVANLDEYLVKYRVAPESMTATYGDKTQEGQQMRIARMAHLLGWDKTNTALNEERFGRIHAILFGTSTELPKQDIRAIGEILRLQSTFCKSFNISRRDGVIHRIKVYRWLFSKILTGSNLVRASGFRSR